MIAPFRELFEQRHDRARALRRQGRKVVASFYGLTPRELVHAAGMLPVQLVEEHGDIMLRQVVRTCKSMDHNTPASA